MLQADSSNYVMTVVVAVVANMVTLPINLLITALFDRLVSNTGSINSSIELGSLLSLSVASSRTKSGLWSLAYCSFLHPCPCRCCPLS